MKTKLQYLVVLVLAFGTVVQLSGQGYIVPNGVTYLGLNFAGAYEIDVIHDPTNAYSTGFYFSPKGETPPAIYPNTFEFAPIVDVSVRVFFVASNQPVSLQPIMANTYTELMFPGRYIFDDGVPFYVGLYTGNMTYYPPSGIYDDPLFGWARLVNNQGAIEMLDSALAYKAQGIFAGTHNFVPEPSTFGLFGLGASLLGWRFLRKRT